MIDRREETGVVFGAVFNSLLNSSTHLFNMNLVVIKLFLDLVHSKLVFESYVALPVLFLGLWAFLSLENHKGH